MISTAMAVASPPPMHRVAYATLEPPATQCAQQRDDDACARWLRWGDRAHKRRRAH